MESNLNDKLSIAFRYGIKATENYQHEKDFDEAYFNRAIAVINRLYSNVDEPALTN